MDVLYDIVVTINTYLSNYVLIILLVAMGLVFTIRTKFVQIRFFGEGMRRVFGEFNLFGGKKKSGISSFQALATAVAAQVGTGNIVGAWRRHLDWRSGCHLLDVAHRLPRHGDQLCGGRARPEDT